MTALPVTRFAVCVVNEGYEASVQRNQIYAVHEAAEAASDGDVRIADESGEDYLYPADWFILIDVPAIVQQSVLRVTA